MKIIQENMLVSAEPSLTEGGEIDYKSRHSI